MLVLSGLFAVISISFAQPSGLRQSRPVHPDGMRPIRVPGMPVRTVDEAVKNPEAVVRLDLSGQTGITDLSFLGQLVNLQHLRLVGCGLTEIPASLERCVALEILDLRNNRITKVPAILSKLPKLKVIILSDNDGGFASIPELAALERLTLDRCRLERIPSGIGACRQLKEITLDYNSLGRIDPDIAQLDNLESISAAHNRLTEYPSILTGIESLKNINVSFNHIDSVRAADFNKPGLQELVIAGNGLTALPARMDNPDLLSLNADTNQITAIPASIAACRQLVRLSMAHNRIQSLPREIGQCKQLQAIDVSGNDLLDLPVSELADLPVLQTLKIARNPQAPDSPDVVPNIRR